MKGECPNCGTMVPIKSSVKVGYITYCPGCDVELEIINLNPVELDYPIIDEDFDDDDEYEYETDFEYEDDDDY